MYWRRYIGQVTGRSTRVIPLLLNEENVEIELKYTLEEKKGKQFEFGSSKSIRTAPNLFAKLDEELLNHIVDC